MKFARYLDSAQAPEWKRAYIDYRSLKKRITAIRRARGDAGSQVYVSSESDSGHPPRDTRASAHCRDGQEITDEGHGADDETNARSGRREHQTDVNTPADSIALKELKRSMDDHGKVTTSASSETTSAPQFLLAPGRGVASPQPLETKQSALPPLKPRPGEGLRRRTTARFVSSHSLTLSPTTHPPTLAEVLEPLPPIQLEFFNKFNTELSKVESFFIEREAGARERSMQLRGQLEELKDHRRLFHEAHPDFQAVLPLLPSSGSKISTLMNYLPHLLHRSTHTDNKAHNADVPREFPARHLAGGTRLDPDEYLHARKQLKRAVSEHYHALEVLNNYRILNITGFRKALKKFEKATGVLVQDLYMKEKVDSCAFASDDTVQQLLKEMEDSFTARFAKGDRKRALVRLRAGSSHKTHHFSTFRTGIALGLALPAVIDGIVRCLQPHTRVDIPSWGSLLFIYANLLVPTLFALLVGTNMLIWTASRINYVFIFDLDIRTRLDHREYFEIPCIIFATLCWAFWLSFTRSGEPTIQPWTWPMIWLLFVVVLIINPLPVMSRESRWWFLRRVARVLLSGFGRVEFTDFWLGDQFCSLVFLLGNIYFIACSYAGGFGTHSFQKCSKPTHWGVPFLLGSMPFFARFGQSIRRWWDSGSITHLINAGKYFMGIAFYFCYQLWRHNGGHGTSFIFFCLFGTIYSTYNSAWDLLMDWSLLRPHARFMFLREELLYSSYIPFYYLAIITNVLLRFTWILYIPTRGPSVALRTWLVALLEVLRRSQWNVYRLENEHLGNMDQYRITREVPLPYSFDEIQPETDVGDEDDEPQTRSSIRSSKSK